MKKCLIILLLLITSLLNGMVVINNTTINTRKIASAPSYVTSGLIAYYKLDGNANAGDGYGTNGTDHSNTYLANPAAGAYILGCTTMTASNQYVDCNSALLPSSNFSIECWLKFSQMDANYYPYIFSQGSNGSGRLLVQIITDKRIHIEIDTNDGGYNGTGTVDFKNWTHLVIAKNGTRVDYYLNGVWSSSTTLAGSVGTGANTTLGWTATSHNGVMDEVRIYNKALSAAEVSQNYALH